MLKPVDDSVDNPERIPQQTARFTPGITIGDAIGMRCVANRDCVARLKCGCRLPAGFHAQPMYQAQPDRSIR